MMQVEKTIDAFMYKGIKRSSVNKAIIIMIIIKAILLFLVKV